MQHKDIVDSERHEVKGASTALVGTIPVSNGGGGTSFQKIGVLSLSGSLPTNIVNQLIATDGAGGFKAVSSQTFGSFELSVPLNDLVNPSNPSTPRFRYSSSLPYIGASGLSCSGGILTVNTTGTYVVSAGGYEYTPPVDVTPPSSKVFFANMYNYQTGALVSAAQSVPRGVFLEVSKQYVLELAGNINTITLTVEKVGV